MDCTAKIIALAKKEKTTIALAESATAGYASYLLTKIPGSSQIIKGALVVYSLESKKNFFKIPSTELKKTKGVSKPISIILAKQVRKLFCATYGVSIIGFAGPTSRAGVQAGTFLITIATPKKHKNILLKINNSRNRARKHVSKAALKNLLSMMKEEK